MSHSRNSREHRIAGFTLIELMVVVSIIGILASTVGAKYLQYVEKARIARSIAEMRGVAKAIDVWLTDSDGLPESLAEIGISRMLDPWGSEYLYLPIAGMLPAQLATAPAPLPSVSAPPSNPNPNPNPDADGGGGGGSVIASARKDRFMVPINSDYDLYSAGPDGKSKAPLQAPVSRDDVIRAGDGSYYGLAENF